MKQFLDIDDEGERLEWSLAQRLGPELLATSRTVLDTLRIRPQREPRWTKRLSPFVVLYPLLQSQAWSTEPTDQARRANEVHLLLLIHCFIDDRVVDGQHALTATEIVLAKQALLEALRVAREASLLQHLVEPIWLTTFERYHNAQLRRYSHGIAQIAGSMLDANERIVACRAAPGVLAVLTTAHAAGQAGRTVTLSDAFDRLSVGLQWEDDLHDWPHDMLTEQQNLMLASLPRDVFAAAAVGDDRLRAVDQCLIDSGIYASAVDNAAHRLQEAAVLQSGLGATQLADAIGQHRQSVVALGVQLKREVAKETTVQS